MLTNFIRLIALSLCLVTLQTYAVDCTDEIKEAQNIQAFDLNEKIMNLNYKIQDMEERIIEISQKLEEDSITDFQSALLEKEGMSLYQRQSVSEKRVENLSKQLQALNNEGCK